MGGSGALLTIVLIAFFVAACGGDEPDLTRSAWKSIEIEYCTPRIGTKVWSSRDAAQLEAFRAAMNPTDPAGLTMVLRSYTNEIRLELASGQRWHLYYRDHPGKVAFHDPNAVTRSFLVRVSDQLLAKISAALTAAERRERCQEPFLCQGKWFLTPYSAFHLILRSSNVKAHICNF